MQSGLLQTSRGERLMRLTMVGRLTICGYAGQASCRDGTRCRQWRSTCSIQGERKYIAMLVLLIILLLLFGVGGGYYGHSRWGTGGGAGVGLGTILLILLLAYMLGIVH